MNTSTTTIETPIRREFCEPDLLSGYLFLVTGRNRRISTRENYRALNLALRRWLNSIDPCLALPPTHKWVLNTEPSSPS
eukprot:COSAG02_NODE_49_length_45106_cov_298.436177_8_plen_79_part_00